MMEAAKHRYCDDLSGLSAWIRRVCCRRAGRTLANGAMGAPVVEITDILTQDLLQMAPIEYEHVVQALGPDRSHPALGDRVGLRRSERRARLGNTEMAQPPIESAAITAVAVMNEETYRLAVPTAAFDNLLYVQSAVGCDVTCTWRTCRLAWWITKNTYSVLNVMVWTQKKSHAQMVDACCLRNDRQR